MSYQVPPPPRPCRKHYMGSIYCVYIHVCVDVNVHTKCLVDACITKMQVCVYNIILGICMYAEMPRAVSLGIRMYAEMPRAVS